MTRTARVWSGAVLAGTLLLIALVAGIIAAVSSAGDLGFGDFLASPAEPVDAQAEILDVDDDPFLGGVTFVDISFTDDNDEVVVTYVEWYGDTDPRLGATMAIVYDATDPEYAFDALDPVVGGAEPATEPDAAADERDGIRWGAMWVALPALVAGLLVGALTVPWALAKPARDRSLGTADGAAGGRYPPGPAHPGYPMMPQAAATAYPSATAAPPVYVPPQASPARPSDISPPPPRSHGWREPF